MKLKKITAFFFLLLFCFSFAHAANASGTSIPTELDFVSETDGLPDNWEAYRQTFESLEHPFMLTSEADFEALRSVRNTEPWKSLRENAESVVNKYSSSLVPKAGQDAETQWKNFAVLIGDNALLYILDESNQSTYKNNILNLMQYWDKDNEVNLYDEIWNEDGDGWTRAIPPTDALINSVLALDIIYPSLSQSEIDYCEAVTGDAAQKFFDYTEAHYHNTYGIRAFWAAYIKDYDLLYENYSLYMQHYAPMICDNGFPADSFGYSFGRFATDNRLGKMIVPVMVKKMGISNHYFDWELSKHFAENVVSYMYAPNGTMWPIGDTAFYKNEKNNSLNSQALLPYYSSYFGEAAASASSWFLKNNYTLPNFKIGTLVAYLLCENELAESHTPKSKVFEQGGAFLYENMDNSSSLGALLYNLGMDETAGHGHNETNSFMVAAYNQLLLANSGYNSWGMGAGDFSWNYIHGSAYSANTVLIDYDPIDVHDPSQVNNHVLQSSLPYPKGSAGAGITKSLITDLFAYASGDTGEDRNTLPNGRHIRNAAMIAAQDDAPGYFAVLDQISSDTPEVNATVMWRPASTDYTIVDSDSWRWHVTAQDYEAADVTIHTTEHPNEVSLVDGISAGWQSYVPMKCLEAKFTTDANGKRSVGTVIFPSNAQNPEADISRFEGDGIKGSKVELGYGVEDYIIYTSSGESGTYSIPAKNGVSAEALELDGSWAILRKIKDNNGFMFAMNATRMLCGEQGFWSDLPVDFYLKDGIGKIVCTANAEVTIRDYGVTAVHVDGTVAAIRSNSISHTFTLSEGEHDIELIYDESKRQQEISDYKSGTNAYTAFFGFETLGDDYSLTSGGTLTENGSNQLEVQFGENIDSSEAKVSTATGFGKTADDAVLHISHSSGSESDLIQMTSYTPVEVPADKYYITSVQYRVSEASNMTFNFRFANLSNPAADARSGVTAVKFNGYTATVGTETLNYTKDQWVTVTCCIKGHTDTMQIYTDGKYITEIKGSIDGVVCKYAMTGPARAMFYGRSGAANDAYIDNFYSYLSDETYDGTNADAYISKIPGGRVDNESGVISVLKSDNNPLTVSGLKKALGEKDGKLSDGKNVRIYSSAPAIGDTLEALDSDAVTGNTVVYVQAKDGITLKAYSVKAVQPTIFYGFDALSDDYSITSNDTIDTNNGYSLDAQFGAYDTEISVATGFGKAADDKALKISHKDMTDDASVQLQSYSKKEVKSDEYYNTTVQYKVNKNSKMRFTLRFSSLSDDDAPRSAVRIIDFDGLTATVGSKTLSFSENQWVTVTGSIKGGTDTIYVYVDGEYAGAIKGDIDGEVCNYLKLMPGRLSIYGDATMMCDTYIDNFYGYISISPYDRTQTDTTLSSANGAAVDNEAKIIRVAASTDVAALKSALGVTNGELSDGKKVRIFYSTPGAGDIVEASDTDAVTENTIVYVESQNGTALKAYAVELLPDLEATKIVAGKKANVTLSVNKAFDGDALIALYSGSELVGIEIVESSDLLDDTADIVKFNTDGNLRVFVWDMQTLTPIPVNIRVVQQ